jgi:hypothetical protein
VIVRLLLWSLGDSKTSLDEVRAHLAPDPNRTWISDESSERFGVIERWDDEPESFPADLRDLIGKDPEIAEKFDVEG